MPITIQYGQDQMLGLAQAAGTQQGLAQARAIAIARQQAADELALKQYGIDTGLQANRVDAAMQLAVMGQRSDQFQQQFAADEAYRMAALGQRAVTAEDASERGWFNADTGRGRNVLMGGIASAKAPGELEKTQVQIRAADMEALRAERQEKLDDLKRQVDAADRAHRLNSITLEKLGPATWPPAPGRGSQHTGSLRRWREAAEAYANLSATSVEDIVNRVANRSDAKSASTQPAAGPKGVVSRGSPSTQPGQVGPWPGSANAVEGETYTVTPVDGSQTFMVKVENGKPVRVGG
jgi:hypothetical protein